MSGGQRWLVVGALAACALASRPAGAEPEGYQGGEGRDPGETYVPQGGPPAVSITVRGVRIEPATATNAWSCDAGPATTEDLVTVLLRVSNPTRHPLPRDLPNLDLVIELDGARDVVSGSCMLGGAPADDDATLAPRSAFIARVRFLVPRKAVPKILVYNDDDFPALFALPKAKRGATKPGHRK